MKHFATATNGDNLCWEWTVNVIQKKNTAAVKIAKKIGVIFVPFFMANPRANQK